MIFGVPQTISIALGAVLITLVDYRLEILAMVAGVAISAAYLLTREPREPRLDAAVA
jgi:hypothetical protein